MTKRDFICQLSKDAFEAEAACLLWDALVGAAAIDDFRPLPDDNFLDLYGLADEDLDEDIIIRIFERLEVPLPHPSIVEEVGEIATPAILMDLLRKSRNKDGRVES